MTQGQLQRRRINRRLSHQPGPKKYLEFCQSIKSHNVLQPYKNLSFAINSQIEMR